MWTTSQSTLISIAVAHVCWAPSSSAWNKLFCKFCSKTQYWSSHFSIFVGKALWFFFFVDVVVLCCVVISVLGIQLSASHVRQVLSHWDTLPTLSPGFLCSSEFAKSSDTKEIKAALSLCWKKTGLSFLVGGLLLLTTHIWLLFSSEVAWFPSHGLDSYFLPRAGVINQLEGQGVRKILQKILQTQVKQNLHFN